MTDAFEKCRREHPLWLEVSEVSWSAGSIVSGTWSTWQKGDGSKSCLSHSVLKTDRRTGKAMDNMLFQGILN